MFRFIQKFSNSRFFAKKSVHNVSWYQNPTPNISVNSILPNDTLFKDFYGENIVITDTSGSLGKALAQKLGKLNANVAIWGNDAEDLKETSESVKLMGGHVLPYLCDTSRRDEIYRIAEKTRRDIGEVSIVINTTDVACQKLFLDTPDYLLKKAFDSNVMSHFWITKAFLPSMVESNKGHIVTVASMAGFMGIQKLSDYCASKSAAISFLNALRTELDREGSNVKTTVICPYFVNGSGLHGKPRFRFMKPLDASEVADRTITAIRKKEAITFIPGWLRYIMIPRWLIPSFITSFINKLLIKDASPTETAPSAVNSFRIVQFVRKEEAAQIKIEENLKLNLKKYVDNDSK